MKWLKRIYLNIFRENVSYKEFDDFITKGGFKSGSFNMKDKNSFYYYNNPFHRIEGLAERLALLERHLNLKYIRNLEIAHHYEQIVENMLPPFLQILKRKHPDASKRRTRKTRKRVLRRRR